MRTNIISILIIVAFFDLFAEDFNELRFTQIKIKFLQSYDITKFIKNEGDIISIKADEENHLYLNFSTSPKIYKFQLTPEFKLLASFNKEGTGPGEMFAPVTFCLLNDKICVTDKDGIRLSIFDLEGNPLHFFSTTNVNKLILFQLKGKVYGFMKIPAKYFNETKDPNSLYTFRIDGETLIPENSCCPVPSIGSYLVNQMSDFLVVNDSLLFVAFKYIDKIICYNLNHYSFTSFGSPAQLHLKSPMLGETITRKKKFTFRLTGKEYICYHNIFQFSSHILGAFYWGKQPKSFSFSDIVNGNIGGQIIHFFNLYTGSYLFSINLPFRLSNLIYSKNLDMWIGLKGNLYEIVTFKIEGI